MKSPLSILQKKSFKQDGIVLAAFLFLLWNYVAHGVQALLISEKYIPITTYVGLPSWTLVLVGIMDLCIALALFFRPNKYVVVYALLWPIAPLVLEYLVFEELEIVGKLLLWAAGLIILFFPKKN